MKILQEILVPQESVNDQTLTVVGLSFTTGDKVKKDDVLIELETSKAIITLDAEVDGYVIYHCKVDDDVPLNALVVQIADSKPEGADIAAIVDPHPEKTSLAVVDSPTDRQSFDTQFSKKALAVLEKNNLSKDVFKHHDLVNEDIILNYLNPGRAAAKTSAVPVAAVPAVVKQKATPKSEEFLSKVSLEKLSSGKRREIEYLSAVQSSSLISTLHIDVDTTGIIANISNKFKYFKTSILPLVTFEAAKLLLKYPLLNAYYEDGHVGKYNSVHVGLAIDIDDGLKVVKIPDTPGSGILEIEEKIFQLSNKYLDKKLEVSDFIDITFTITDLSAAGTYLFTPLVNKDNSAILGISAINPRSGNCVLSLSFDHRVTSGKYAGNFLAELKARIESFAFGGDAVLPVMECYKCLKSITEDANDIGFIKVQTKNGYEKLICDTCLFKF